MRISRAIHFFVLNAKIAKKEKNEKNEKKAKNVFCVSSGKVLRPYEKFIFFKSISDLFDSNNNLKLKIILKISQYIIKLLSSSHDCPIIILKLIILVI